MINEDGYHIAGVISLDIFYPLNTKCVELKFEFWFK